MFKHVVYLVVVYTTYSCFHTKKNNPRVIVGHDYRSYSEEIKTFLKKGLISTGCSVEDIGLA